MAQKIFLFGLPARPCMGADAYTGTCIANGHLSDGTLMKLVEKHFNAVTFENELKMDAVFGYQNDAPPEMESVTWTRADGTVMSGSNQEYLILYPSVLPPFPASQHLLHSICPLHSRRFHNSFPVPGYVSPTPLPLLQTVVYLVKNPDFADEDLSVWKKGSGGAAITSE